MITTKCLETSLANFKYSVYCFVFGILRAECIYPVVLLLFCCVQKEKITSHPPLKKLKSLNDLDQANDDQEIEFLKLQVLEQQSMIDDLTRVSTSCEHET